jgi:hypothetical protein
MPLLFSGSYFLLIQLLDVIDELRYLLYINILFPDPVNQFFNLFSSVSADVFPRFISINYDKGLVSLKLMLWDLEINSPIFVCFFAF